MTNPPIIVTAATDEALILPEIKLFLREDLVDTENDAQILMLYQAAREHVEGQTSRRLMEQTLKCYHSGWPYEDFRLPVGPVQSIDHIKYYDTEDTEYTLAATEYSLDGESNPPIIRQNYNKTWPSITLRTLNPVEVQFVAGYASASAVPARLKNAVLLILATLYRHRETVTVGNSGAVASLIPQHFQAFLDSMKVHA